MGVLGEVLAVFFLLAAGLLAGGAYMTRPLWLPYVQRLKLEERRRRAKALEERETREHRADAAQEIDAFCDPRQREDASLPPQQEIHRQG